MGRVGQNEDDEVSEVSLIHKLFRSFLRPLSPKVAVPASPLAAPLSLEEQKISAARMYLRTGAVPCNFSINLGYAPCNHTCLFCPQSVVKPDKAVWLDLDLLRKVLEEMPEEGVYLHVSSYSETLTAPNLIPAIGLMKKLRPKLPIIMASNGSLWREDVVSLLIDLGLDWYSYSFDAPNREGYAKLMQKDDFDAVGRNLERLIDLRNSKGSVMKITTHIMAFKEFEADFEIFKQHWLHRLDGINFRKISNWGSDDYGLEQQLTEAGYNRIHSAPAQRFPCTSIFSHFKLSVEGDYYPCVAAVPGPGIHKVKSLGNARDISWWEAWDRLGEMRQAHLEGRWDDCACCGNCDIWGVSYNDIWFRETGPDGRTHFTVKGVDYARGPGASSCPG